MGVHLCMKSRVGVLHSPVRRIAQAGVFPAFFRRISIDPCPPCVPASPMAPLPQRAPPGGCLPCCRVWCRARRCRCWRPGRGRPRGAGGGGGGVVGVGRAAAAMFAVCGLRAWGYMEQALAPALEGQDIRVTGLVAAMPQASETGTRLRLEVDSALLRGQAVRLPPRIEVGWYGAGFGDANADAGQAPGLRGRAPGGRGGGLGDGNGGAGQAPGLRGRPPVVRAGERWALTVRLKAPHGMRNPHGFDYELWLWEQGVQATGYVRTGPKDAPPLRLGATWRHPVERWRQSVRDAIVERLGGGAQDSSEPLRARIAGVVAALVTGDQRAIERVDWELFRATGVAHLMSISGLHITLFAWLAALAVRTLWRRSTGLCLAVPAPSAALVAGVLLAAGYALFSGWGVPAQRAALALAPGLAAGLRGGGAGGPLGVGAGGFLVELCRRGGVVCHQSHGR